MNVGFPARLRDPTAMECRPVDQCSRQPLQAQIGLLTRVVEALCASLPPDAKSSVANNLCRTVSDMKTPSELADAAQVQVLVPIMDALGREGCRAEANA